MSLSAAGLVQTQPFLVSKNIRSKQTRRNKPSIVVAAGADLDFSFSNLTKDVPSKVDTPTVTVVPGTEVIPPPSPESIPTPSQGMDFVLEQLKAKEAASSSIQSTPSLSPSSPPQLPSVKLPDIPSFELPSVDLPSINFDVKSATDAIVPPKELGESIDSATAAASAAASQLAEQLDGVASQAASAVSGAQSEAQSLINSVQSTITDTTAGIQSTVQSQVSSVQSTLQTALQSQIDAVLDKLPPGTATAITSTAHTITDAASYLAKEQPTVAGVVAALAVGGPAFLAWNASFGGYAGPFSPEKALEVLKTTDALLVDVRSEQQRLADGVPELKRGARGKATVVPMYRLLPSIARRVRSPNELSLQILGAEIAALSRVAPGTRIIIIDNSGEVATAVARAATAAGHRYVHTLSGGFRAWRSAGLPIDEKSAVYSDNPLGVVNDAAETVVEEASQLFSKPTTAAGAIGVLALASLFIANYHLAFQYIGVLSLEATLALRIISYDSVDDALNDVNGVVDAVKGVVGLVSQTVGTSVQNNDSGDSGNGSGVVVQEQQVEGESSEDGSNTQMTQLQEN